jgi:hypothetical protein
MGRRLALLALAALVAAAEASRHFLSMLFMEN